MKSYYHLPHGQRRVQQLVAQFNADEQLWRSLEAMRRRRRKVHPRMSAKLRRQIDLLEFANSRPLQDCADVLSVTEAVGTDQISDVLNVFSRDRDGRDQPMFEVTP